MSYRRYGEFHAFSETRLSDALDQRRLTIESAIKNQPDNYILNVNEQEYLDHLVSEYSTEPLLVIFDDVYVSTYEAQIPAEWHPNSYMARQGQSFPRDIIKYHIPFVGDEQLFKLQPNTHYSYSPIIVIEDSCVCIDIINFNHSPEEIKQKSDREIDMLKNNIENLNNDLSGFNNSIEQLARRNFTARKKQLMEKNDLIAALGVPVKKSNETPGTFSVPTKRTPAIVSKPKPQVTETEFKPEPVRRQKIWHRWSKKLRETFIYYSSVSLVRT
jgi:hypothetical protein